MPMTRPPYSSGFREQMVELVRSGRSPEELAREFDLIWQFMALANPILNRSWDNDETVLGAFNADDLGTIAFAAGPDPRRLADRAFEALIQNAHGQYDDLIRVLTPALGHDGLERLKQLMVQYSNTPVAELPEAHRRRIHWRYLGTPFEAEKAERLRLQTARSALQDIADAQGDVDAFMDQVDEDTRKGPRGCRRDFPQAPGGGTGRGGSESCGCGRMR